MKLYLVRGHDVDLENQDLFCCAPDPTRAIALWNEWCIENGFPREDGDEGGDDEDRIVDPSHVREILDDVTGTNIGTAERAVDWDEFAIVA